MYTVREMGGGEEGRGGEVDGWGEEEGEGRSYRHRKWTCITFQNPPSLWFPENSSLCRSCGHFCNAFLIYPRFPLLLCLCSYLTIPTLLMKRWHSIAKIIYGLLIHIWEVSRQRDNIGNWIDGANPNNLSLAVMNIASTPISVPLPRTRSLRISDLPDSTNNQQIVTMLDSERSRHSEGH